MLGLEDPLPLLEGPGSRPVLTSTGGHQFRGRDNKYSVDELMKMIGEEEDEFGFNAWCNMNMAMEEDLDPDIADDPQFRALYKHMMVGQKVSMLLGLTKEQVNLITFYP